MPFKILQLETQISDISLPAPHVPGHSLGKLHTYKDAKHMHLNRF